MSSLHKSIFANKFALFAIVSFMGFYTVKLKFSIIYLTFSAGILALILGSNFKIERELSRYFVVPCCLFVSYIGCIYLIVWNADGLSPSATINLIFSLLYFVVTLIVINKSSYLNVVKAYEYSLNLSIFILIIELVYRLMNPAVPEEWNEFREDIFWYIYKTSSLMYPDSNTVGLFVSCLVAFIVSLPTHLAGRFGWYLVPLILLLLGTLSRAAILATAIVILFRYFFINRPKIAVLSIAVICIGMYYSAKYIDDESMLSKFWIAELAMNYLAGLDFLNLLLGVGPGGAEKAIGVGAHILLYVWLIEIGLFGTCFIILLWVAIWAKAGSGSSPLFLVFILNGLSFTTFATPWFYSLAAGLIFFNRYLSSARFCANSGIQRTRLC